MFVAALRIAAFAMFVTVLLSLFSAVDGAYFVLALGVTHEATPGPQATVTRTTTESGLAHSGLYREDAAVERLMHLLAQPIPPSASEHQDA